MDIEKERADFESWLYLDQTKYDPERMSEQEIEIAKQAYLAGRAALQSQFVKDGWKEAAIAWEVCASLHREFCKGRDPLFKVRQSDFVKHAEDARTRALETEALQSQDAEDAERYRWIRDEAGLMVLPYDDHGMGPEFPGGSDLDKAIDHARRMQEQPIPYAGVTVWVGDKRCSHGVSKDELELSTFDILQAAFDHARRIEGEGE